jgi:hypothetical protein
MIYFIVESGGRIMRMPVLIISSLAIVMWLSLSCSWAGITRTPRPIDYESAVITLERTACFGTCPVYKLTIYGDGRVVYVGGDFVGVKGTQTAEITRADVKAVVDEFYRIDYFSLQSEYTAPITDLPTTITSISIGGTRKQVTDYHGAPQKLRDLEKRIDEIAGSSKWVERHPGGR